MDVSRLEPENVTPPPDIPDHKKINAESFKASGTQLLLQTWPACFVKRCPALHTAHAGFSLLVYTILGLIFC